MVTNKPRGTLYIGVTNDLARRVYEHREGLYSGFTKLYRLKKLAYYENYPLMLEAIAREKKLKTWNRDWKIDLVESFNPDWDDLYFKLNA